MCLSARSLINSSNIPTSPYKEIDIYWQINSPKIFTGSMSNTESLSNKHTHLSKQHNRMNVYEWNGFFSADIGLKKIRWAWSNMSVKFLSTLRYLSKEIHQRTFRYQSHSDRVWGCQLWTHIWACSLDPFCNCV